MDLFDADLDAHVHFPNELEWEKIKEPLRPQYAPRLCRHVNRPDCYRRRDLGAVPQIATVSLQAVVLRLRSLDFLGDALH